MVEEGGVFRGEESGSAFVGGVEGGGNGVLENEDRRADGQGKGERR